MTAMTMTAKKKQSSLLGHSLHPVAEAGEEVGVVGVAEAGEEVVVDDDSWNKKVQWHVSVQIMGD